MRLKRQAANHHPEISKAFQIDTEPLNDCGSRDALQRFYCSSGFSRLLPHQCPSKRGPLLPDNAAHVHAGIKGSWLYGNTLPFIKRI
jgi:hypothetical protein